jgi:hypothetical protein
MTIESDPEQCHEPPRGDFIILKFNTDRSTRFSFASANLHPPGLKDFAKELGKLARKHRRLPGVGLPPRNHLLGILTHVAERHIRSSGRGGADDFIRACMNAGIIMMVEYVDERGGIELLYDADLMERVLNGETLPDRVGADLLVRARELCAAAVEEAGPESDVQKRVGPPPSLDEALLALVDASREIAVDREHVIEGYLEEPREHLLKTFPACREREIDALVMSAIELGHLNVVGHRAFIIDLHPRKAALEAPEREHAELRMRLELLMSERDESECAEEAAFNERLAEIERQYDAVLHEAAERFARDLQSAHETLSANAELRLQSLLEPHRRVYEEAERRIRDDVARTLETDRETLSLHVEDLRARAGEFIRNARQDAIERMRQDHEIHRRRLRLLWADRTRSVEDRIRDLEQIVRVARTRSGAIT